MRVFLIFFLVCLFSICSFGQSEYRELSIENLKERDFVYDFLKTVYIDKKEPILNPRNSKASFRTRFKEYDVVKQSIETEKNYGIVTELKLIKIQQIENSKQKVFRYKYRRTYFDRDFEMRVFLNEKNKIIGLITMPFWSDKFYKWNEKPVIKSLDTSLLQINFKKNNFDLAFRSYNKCHIDEFHELNEENTTYRSLKSDWKKRWLKECDSIKVKNGNVSNLKFQEFLTDSLSQNIYRYKVNFSKLEKPSEIRIYSSLTDKYTGIFVIDIWYDKYYDFKKAVEKSRNILGN